MRRRALLAAFVALCARPARAAEPPTRTTGIGRREGRLVVSVAVTDLFTRPDIERLRSGFATRVLLTVALYKVGQRQPVAETVRQSEIVYDLWGEAYRVRRMSPGVNEVREVATPSEAIWDAAAFVRFPVAELALLEPGAQYRLSFRADLNPLSEELLAEVRRWLARPRGQGRLPSSDTIFGSFVSIFVNPHVEESDRVVQFFSQPFEEPPR